jgi:hypothetical protein
MAMALEASGIIRAALSFDALALCDFCPAARLQFRFQIVNRFPQYQFGMVRVGRVYPGRPGFRQSGKQFRKRFKYSV